jgi:hypothetical protein
VNDRQDNRGVSLDPGSPDGVPSLFARFVRPVRAHQAILVLEDQGRHFE